MVLIQSAYLDPDSGVQQVMSIQEIAAEIAPLRAGFIAMMVGYKKAAADVQEPRRRRMVRIGMRMSGTGDRRIVTSVGALRIFLNAVDSE